MGKRTIRLDDESELILEELATKMGVSLSEVLRQALLALRDKRQSGAARAFAIYQQLDLGPGGYALAPSTDTRSEMQEVLRRKRR